MREAQVLKSDWVMPEWCDGRYSFDERFATPGALRCPVAGTGLLRPVISRHLRRSSSCFGCRSPHRAGPEDYGQALFWVNSDLGPNIVLSHFSTKR